MPTVLPFHRVVVRDPAFAPSDASTPFSVHTRWIETQFDNTIEAFSGAPGEAAEEGERQRVVVEVGGKRLEVSIPAKIFSGTPSAASPRPSSKRSGSRQSAARSAMAHIRRWTSSEAGGATLYSSACSARR